ncbi:MAG: nucleotidyltransferase domain-containing protein [Planctomycetes bacterium]|nr:nucleotidyltransferase domain-containing protein [Planctomycetota bacterium]
MNEKIKPLINQIKTRLTKLYKAKIKSVMLYGSYVRNEQTKDSDIDVLVVVDQSLNPFSVRESLSDLLFDILLEEGEHISVIVITDDFYENYNSPFILNVKKEGVAA